MKNLRILSVLGTLLFGACLLILAPQATSKATAQATTSKTYVVQHFLERKGRVANTPKTFDTIIYLYAGFAGGLGTLDVDLTLYDKQTGLPLRAANGVVCDPCTISLSGVSRRREIRIENLIDAKGGFPASISQFTGEAHLSVSGSPAALNQLMVQYWLVNSHSGAFDICWSVLQLQPLG